MPKRKIPEEERIKIGWRLRKIREEAGISQNKIAHDTGISKKSLSFYENNRSVPPLHTLLKLARYFDVSLDKIVYRDFELEDLKIKDEGLLKSFFIIDKLERKERDAIKLISGHIINSYRNFPGVKEIIEKYL